MPKQPVIPGLRDAMKKKVTRREQFLAEMDAVVSRVRLLALIAPRYPKAGPKGGRPPVPRRVLPVVRSGPVHRRNYARLPGTADPPAPHGRAGQRAARPERSCSS